MASDTVTCPHCGESVVPGRFCRRCGGPLTDPPDRSPDETTARPTPFPGAPLEPEMPVAGRPATVDETVPIPGHGPTEVPRRSRRTIVVVGAVGVAALLVGAIAWASGRSEEPGPSAETNVDDGAAAADSSDVSTACSSFETAVERAMGGERVADIAEVDRAISEFEAAGEPVAASYLYDWGVGDDLPGWDTPAERAAFWSTAIDFARAEGNPGLARIDELCGHATYVAREPTRSADPPPAAADPPRPDPAPSTTSVPAEHPTTTTTTISFGDAVTGSGSFDDPLVGHGGGSVRFDTFDAWFSVRLYPAGSGQELPTSTDQACVVVDYQAADGVAQVSAAELLDRIGLATGTGVELQRLDGTVQWPDDHLPRLEGSDFIVWGNIVSRAMCYFLPPGEPTEGLLVRVDDVFVEPWHDPTYVLAPASAAADEVGVACEAYSYDDELPIEACSTGLSVEMAQEQLGLEADGFFGPGTLVALRDFQASVGLAVTGVLDVDTWRLLGVGEGLPYDDLNGDGVIDGSEIPFD